MSEEKEVWEEVAEIMRSLRPEYPNEAVRFFWWMACRRLALKFAVRYRILGNDFMRMCGAGEEYVVENRCPECCRKRYKTWGESFDARD
jgi:hypothetical protein